MNELQLLEKSPINVAEFRIGKPLDDKQINQLVAQKIAIEAYYKPFFDKFHYAHEEIEDQNAIEKLYANFVDIIKNIDFVIRVVRAAPSVITVINFIINIKEGKMTQSTLDTIKGILRALAVVAAIFGVNIAPEAIETILTAVGSVWAVIELVLGFISNSKVIKPPSP